MGLQYYDQVFLSKVVPVLKGMRKLFACLKVVGISTVVCAVKSEHGQARTSGTWGLAISKGQMSDTGRASAAVD